MRFAGFADFVVHRDGNVYCIPVDGTDEATQDHIFLNQVVPAVLNMMHRTAFHASCVAIHGNAVAFLGVSRRGKSTLSTYLGLRGHALISDDGVELALSDGHCLAIPGQPAIRLWQDSRRMLLPEEAATLPPISYTSKGRYPSDCLMPFAQRPHPLRSAFFLGDGSAKSVTISPLRGHAAHIAWVQHSPMLDPHDSEQMRTHFAQISQLVGLEISYVLDYPRKYELLPQVEQALRAHCS